MGTLSSNKIEVLAVEAVTREANHPLSLLAPNIPVNDKGISYDGDISVFSSKEETTDTYLGKVPVQVKGQEVKKFSAQVKTYSVKMADLHNYFLENGVVYFVVEINSVGETKIFYRTLLSLDLSSIISLHKKQKSKSLTFRCIEETSLKKVCNFYLTEIKKQPAMLVENQKIANGDFGSYKISS
jgi:hypothetical protein